METISKDEKSSWKLFTVCFITYAIVSMVKNAYSASIASIISEGIFAKSQAGIINSGYYLLYGASQLLCGKLIDRISPFSFITFILGGSAALCVAMCFAKSYAAMLILWSICGFVQFAIWPAILRIIAEYLLPEHRKKAMVYIAFAYCIGMLLNYFVASVLLNFFNWKVLFAADGAILVINLALWRFLATGNIGAIEKQKNKALNKEPVASNPQYSFGRVMIISGLLILLAPSFIRTCLDLGIKSWVPTMIMEIYGVSASFATALTTVLLVVNLSGVFIAGFIYPKRIKNASLAFGICFLLAFPFAIGLMFIGKVPLYVIVLLLVVFTTMMYSGHQLINVIIPSYFAKYNMVGSSAALLNAVASFGAVVSSFLYGFLSEKFGWSTTVYLWIVMLAVALGTAFLASPFWGRFTKDTE